MPNYLSVEHKKSKIRLLSTVVLLPLLTACASTVITAGHSTSGLPMQIYKYGDGKPVIFIQAGIHGNEWQAVTLADRLHTDLQQLDKNGQLNKTVYFLPRFNPDGVKKGSRTNKNGVDLNRNFPVENWQAETRWKGKTFPYGGGQAACSEVECRHMREFLSGYGGEIDLVISIHCCGNLALDDRKSELSRRVSELMHKHYKFRPNPKKSFGAVYYPVTGTFAQYIWQQYRIPHVLLEIDQEEKPPFKKQKEALLKTLLAPLPEHKKSS